jgi:hypothetical protein
LHADRSLARRQPGNDHDQPGNDDDDDDATTTTTTTTTTTATMTL